MTRSSLAFAILALVAPACKKEKAAEVDFLADVDGAANDVYVGDALGAAPLAVPMFGTNLLGASVPSSGLTVASDAALDTTSPALDGLGWGSVSVSEAGAWTVSATAGASTAVGTAWVVAGDPGAWELPAVAPDAPAEQLAVAGGGFVWSQGGEVWWRALAGGAPVRVLNLTDPVDELTTVQLDQDGVTDLLVRSAGNVVLLRGRSAGGLAWERGWASAGGRIVGVALADLNGDPDRDLAIAVDVDGATALAWIDNSGGEYSFTPPLEVPYGAWGLSAEDLDGDGEGEVTLLTTDGLLRRYSHFEGDWATAAVSEFDLQLGDGARLYPSDDFDGDGVEDFVAVGPDTTMETGWQAYIVSTPDRLVYRLFAGSETDPEPAQLWVAEGDLDGDGVLDVAFTTDTTVKLAAWNSEYANFDLFTFPGVPGAAPLTVADMNGDTVADLVLGGSTVRPFAGQRTETGWKVADLGGEVLDFNLADVPWFGDRNGDGVVDLAAFGSGSGLVLEAFLGRRASDSAEETFVGQGALSLGSAADPLDLAVCGDQLYALVNDGAVQKLWRAEWQDGVGLTALDWGVEVDGVAVACDPTGTAWVGASSGTVSTVTDSGSGPVVRAFGSSYGAVQDLAVVSDGGDYSPVACVDADCGILAADLDGDGVEDVAASSATSVTVTTANGSWVVPGGGAISAADADGDGVLDLIRQRDAVVSVYRVLTGGVTPPWSRTLDAPASGAAGVGDLDGDGRADLFVPVVDLDPADEFSWDGTLVYVRAP